MKNLVLLAVVVAFLALAAAPAFCETWIYFESTEDLFYVTTLKIPCAKIVTGFDSCGSGENLAPNNPGGYLDVALTVVKAVSKAALKLAAVLVHRIV
jgi:hypothetical protein